MVVPIKTPFLIKKSGVFAPEATANNSGQICHIFRGSLLPFISILYEVLCMCVHSESCFNIRYTGNRLC